MRVLHSQLALFTIFNFIISLNIAYASTHHSGATLGQFDVDPTGSSNYVIPIKMSPGINGMQPDLAIAYNSQGGNGLMGVGWTLSGIPSIYRCATNLARDGYIDKVDFDSNDQFCLNGQRLIKISTNEYRLETDDYTKVVSSGTAGSGPLSFTAYTKDGKTYQYGGTYESRFEIQSYNDIYLWSVSEIKDWSGNAVSYIYAKDKANGHQRISEIQYTSNAISGLSPTFKVQFGYGARGDQIKSYLLGNLTTIPVILNSIRAIAGGSTVTEYKFGYEIGSTGKSRVISIQECDGSAPAICKSETKMTWQNGQPGINDPAFNTNVSNAGYVNKPLVLDVNGDGKSDLVEQLYGTWWIRFGNGTGFDAGINTGISNQYYQYAQPIDYNGDGLMDIVWPTNSVWMILRSNGSTFEQVSSGASNDGYQNNTMVMDVNGDGLDDLVIARTGTWHIRLNTGGGFGPDINTGFSNANYAHARPIDYDGDGMMDVIYPINSVWTILRSTGNNFQAISTGINNIGWEYNPQFIDMNGDGLQDMLLAYNNYWHLRLNTGNGFGPTISSTINNEYFNQAMAMDYDNDGDLELMVPQFGVWSFIDYTESGLSLKLSGVSNIGWNTYTSTGDFNGDGLTDVISAYSGQWQIRYHTGLYPDLMKSITNGLGEGLEIEYKPLTDSSVYLKHEDYTNEPYPLLNIKAPVYVVSSYDKNTGLSSPNDKYRHEYFYEGLKTHVRGYGSLGFARITMRDPQTTIESVTNYHQYDAGNTNTDDWYRYATTGRVDDVTSKIGNTTLSYSKQIWNLKTSPLYGAAVRVVELASQYDERYELNDGTNTPVTKVTTTNTFDNFGNPLTVLVDSHNGYKKTSNNTYYPADTANWRVGRIQTSNVLSQTADGQTQTNSSSFTYHTNGMLQSETVEPNNPQLEQTTTYLYDTYGNKASSMVTANAGAANADYTSFASTTFNTTINYDYLGLTSPVEYSYPYFKVTTNNSKGLSETTTFDARFGVKLKLVGPNGIPTTWDYDSLGRNIRENRADGSYTQIDYVICELAQSCVDPLMNSIGSPLKIQRAESTGGIANVYFDELGREILKSSTGFNGQNIFVKTEYDAYGRVWRISNPYSTSPQYWNYSQFDVLGRLVRETPDTVAENNPINGYTEIAHNGLVTTTTVHINAYQGGEIRTQSSVKEKNSQGQLVKAFDDSGNFNEYKYDAGGNLRFIWDAARNVTETRYDNAGRKTYMNDPDMGIWQYRYDALGKMRWQQDAKGQIVKMDYDELGRLITRHETEGTSTWTYDTAPGGFGKGKLYRATGPNGYQQIINYDNLSRPISTTTTMDGKSFSISTEYQTNSSRTQIVNYPNGFSVLNHYNSYGHMDKVYKVGTLTPVWEAVIVNERGQVEKEQLGNGLSTIRLYDESNGRLETISTGSSNQIQFLNYQFDSAGNLTQRRDEHDAANMLTEDFTYDNLSRLSTARLSTTVTGALPTVNHLYDSLGNIKEKSDVGLYSYGQNGAGPHAVTSVGSTSYSYDANGNMLSGDGRDLTYTSFNKPSEITKGGKTNTYKYDVNHNRMIKTTSGGTTASSNVFFDDFSDTTLANWSQLRNGRLISVTDATDGAYVRKSSSNDPHGGSATLQRAVSDFEMTFYTKRFSTAGGAYNRYAITDSNGNGYGVYLNRGNGTLGVERRNAWSASGLKNVSMGSVATGQWYTIKFSKQGSTVSASVYQGKVSPASATPLATATATNSTYNNFTQVGIVGGYEFDTDNLQVIDLNPPTQSTSKTTYYISKTYEEVHTGSLIEYKYYVNAGGSTMLYTARSDSSTETRYLHKDHIGSVDAITNEVGTLVECTSFGAWGARRHCDWTTSTSTILSLTSRGFTGHNMDDAVGLIDMNARMYDAKIGRFLQPDIYVQFPDSTQGFNRYTYVNNNPLSHTDPSGNFLKKLYKKTMRHAEKVYNAHKKFLHRTDLVTYGIDKIIYSKPVKDLFLKNSWARTIGMVAASYFGGPMGAAAFSAYLTEIAGGSFEDMVTSFAIAYVSAYMSSGVDNYYGDQFSLSRVAVESTAGGIKAELSGGKFSDGFKATALQSMARYAYNKVVGYDVDETPGDRLVSKTATSRPVRGANNIGTQGDTSQPDLIVDPMKDSLWHEGGVVSRAANQIPGVNAVAGMHDMFQVSMSGVSRNVFNVPGMFIAAGITYEALVSKYDYVPIIEDRFQYIHKRTSERRGY